MPFHTLSGCGSVGRMETVNLYVTLVLRYRRSSWWSRFTAWFHQDPPATVRHNWIRERVQVSQIELRNLMLYRDFRPYSHSNGVDYLRTTIYLSETEIFEDIERTKEEALNRFLRIERLPRSETLNTLYWWTGYPTP